MKYKFLLLGIQALFSAFILLHAVPESNQDPVYRALSLGILGYWFPSPINSAQEEE